MLHTIYNLTAQQGRPPTLLQMSHVLGVIGFQARMKHLEVNGYITRRLGVLRITPLGLEAMGFLDQLDIASS